jgi:hypothetical protein
MTEERRQHCGTKLWNAEEKLEEQQLVEEPTEHDSCRPSGDQQELNSKETEQVCIKPTWGQSYKE